MHRKSFKHTSSFSFFWLVSPKGGHESMLHTQFLAPYLGNHAPPDSNCELIPISYTGNFLDSHFLHSCAHSFGVTANSVTTDEFQLWKWLKLSALLWWRSFGYLCLPVYWRLRYQHQGQLQYVFHRLIRQCKWPDVHQLDLRGVHCRASVHGCDGPHCDTRWAWLLSAVRGWMEVLQFAFCK